MIKYKNTVGTLHIMLECNQEFLDSMALRRSRKNEPYKALVKELLTKKLVEEGYLKNDEVKND